MSLKERLNQVRASNLAKAHKSPFTGQEWGQKFEIERKVLDKFLTLAKQAHPYEFGGLLKVEKIAKGHFRVTDIAFFKQKCGIVTFELDDIEIALWRAKMHKAGEDISLWSGIIHSHPSLNVEPSYPDLNQMVRYAKFQPAWSVICGLNAHVQDGFEVVKVHYARSFKDANNEERVAILKNIPVKRFGRRATKKQLESLDVKTWGTFDQGTIYPTYEWKPVGKVFHQATLNKKAEDKAAKIIAKATQERKPVATLAPPKKVSYGPQGADIYQWQA